MTLFQFRSRTLHAVAALGLCAGCVTRDPRESGPDAANTMLLVNLWQQVRAYYQAASDHDKDRAEALFNRIRPHVDAHRVFFLETLASSKNDDEKVMAAGALGFASNRDVIRYLQDALRSPIDGVRANACVSLGTIRYKETPAEPVVALLDDPSPTVRQAAGMTLSQILQRGQGTLFLIEEDILNWSGLCQALMGAVRRGKDKDGKPLEPAPSPGRRVVELLAAEARESAEAGAVTKTFDDARRGPLLLALNAVLKRRDFYQDQDFEGVALSSEAQALLKRDRASLADRDVQRLNRLLLEAAFPQLIGPAPGRERGWALEALLRALDDEDPLTRNNAIIALRTIASPEAVDRLIRKGLTDNERWVRLNAASTLGEIGDRRAVEPLILAMRDNQQDRYVLEAVKYGLRKITGQDFGGSYTNWKNWWEDQKRPPPKLPGQEEADKDPAPRYGAPPAADASAPAGAAPAPK